MDPKRKAYLRNRRRRRVRKKVFGLPLRPRLSVHRTLRHIYAQIIDDVRGVTLAFSSSLKLESSGGKTKTDKAREVGTLIAKQAKNAGIEKVVFDRGGFLYCGRIKALAEAARKAGLKF